MGSFDKINTAQNVILFDGVCNLCSGSVQFTIKRDKKKFFRFASLQSAYGQRQLQKFEIDSNQLQSVILIRANQVFQQSDAALEIARKLNGGWPLLYIFKIIPRFIRDAVYRLVANNRYRFFGKKDACWIPTPELRDRFIE